MTHRAWKFFSNDSFAEKLVLPIFSTYSASDAVSILPLLLVASPLKPHNVSHHVLTLCVACDIMVLHSKPLLHDLHKGSFLPRCFITTKV